MRNHSEEAGPSPPEVVEQALRVAGSAGFKGSDPVRNVLLFLAERYRESPVQPVKEYELATRALGLDDSYDSSTDSNVRVSVSRLRGKLAEYYVHDGAEDTVLLEVPKGTYVLSASYRKADSGNSLKKGVPKARRFGRRLLLVALAVICFGVAGYLAGRRMSRPEIPASARTFWTHFAGQSPGVVIVFANPRFMGTPETGMRLLKDRSATAEPVVDLYTGTGEVLAVRALTRQLDRMGVKTQVKRALLFTWDEARSTDLIFVGGGSQNFALSQLPHLEKFNFETSAEKVPPVSVVRNEKPQPGEEARYVSSYAWTDGSEYAVVALTPGGGARAEGAHSGREQHLRHGSGGGFRMQRAALERVALPAAGAAGRKRPDLRSAAEAGHSWGCALGAEASVGVPPLGLRERASVGQCPALPGLRTGQAGGWSRICSFLRSQNILRPSR